MLKALQAVLDFVRSLDRGEFPRTPQAVRARAFELLAGVSLDPLSLADAREEAMQEAEQKYSAKNPDESEPNLSRPLFKAVEGDGDVGWRVLLPWVRGPNGAWFRPSLTFNMPWDRARAEEVAAHYAAELNRAVERKREAERRRRRPGREARRAELFAPPAGGGGKEKER